MNIAILFYYGRHITVEQAGNRLMRVECENCNCEYYYVMTRIGRGERMAHYGIAVGSLTNSADRDSQKDLENRLTEEAELVPCPKCNWINDQMVQSYRQTWYRSAGKWAFVIGFAGTILSFVCAWFISGGMDRDAMPYFLYGGPVVSILSGISILALRSWLRSRIRPNSSYPQPPKLPPASPIALLKDPDTEEYKPAKPVAPPESGTNPWIEFQLGRDVLPPVCCGCLQSPHAGNAYQVKPYPNSQTMVLDIPACQACARIVSRHHTRVFLQAAGIGVLIVIPIVWLLNLPSPECWIIGVLFGSITTGIAMFVTRFKTDPFKCKLVDQSRGVVKLQFRNPAYSQLFTPQFHASGPKHD